MADERARDYGPDDPVPDDAVMVRGAPINVSILRSNARKCWKVHDFYGISMFALPGCDAVEVAGEIGIPHDEICEASAGAIRAEGFELRRTFLSKRGHFSIVFAGKPSNSQLRTVVELFVRCEDNPYKRSD